MPFSLAGAFMSKFTRWVVELLHKGENSFPRSELAESFRQEPSTADELEELRKVQDRVHALSGPAGRQRARALANEMRSSGSRRRSRRLLTVVALMAACICVAVVWLRNDTKPADPVVAPAVKGYAAQDIPVLLSVASDTVPPTALFRNMKTLQLERAGVGKTVGGFTVQAINHDEVRLRSLRDGTEVSSVELNGGFASAAGREIAALKAIHARSGLTPAQFDRVVSFSRLGLPAGVELLESMLVPESPFRAEALREFGDQKKYDYVRGQVTKLFQTESNRSGLLLGLASIDSPLTRAAAFRIAGDEREPESLRAIAIEMLVRYGDISAVQSLAILRTSGAVTSHQLQNALQAGLAEIQLGTNDAEAGQ